MDFFETIGKRRSVRSYSDRPVEKEKLAAVLEAARTAPTAKNLQAFKVFVISTRENKEALERVYGARWFCEAPYVLLICSDTSRRWIRADGKDYGNVDCAIVMDHMILAATALGLGTCWIGAFDARAAADGLRLPPGLEPVAFTPLGYANETPPARKRRSLDELVEYR